MMKRSLVVLSLTVLAAGLVCGGLALAARGGRKGGGKPAPPAPPAVEGVVVFTGSCTAGDKLYVMNPDGTGGQQLDIGLSYPRVMDVSRGPYPATALVIAIGDPDTIGYVHFLAIPVADLTKTATLNNPQDLKEPVPRTPVF